LSCLSLIVDPNRLGSCLSILIDCNCVKHLIFAWNLAQDHLREVARWNCSEVGRPAWDFSCFASILYVVFLKSQVHQNSWNSLMLVNIGVLWSKEPEIWRNVGGRNHWKRPPTGSNLNWYIHLLLSSQTLDCSGDRQYRIWPSQRQHQKNQKNPWGDRMKKPLLGLFVRRTMTLLRPNTSRNSSIYDVFAQDILNFVIKQIPSMTKIPGSS